MVPLLMLWPYFSWGVLWQNRLVPHLQLIIAMDQRFTIARNIRFRRIYLGFSQKELAKRVSYSRVALCRIESGKRSIPSEDLSNFAVALQVPVGDLFVADRFCRD
jgi:DNA-binding XRE family transcriptional regulator